MSSFYRNSLLGMPRDHFLYAIGKVWDSISIWGAKRRHHYKVMLAMLEEHKEQLSEQEYTGLKLRIQTAFED